VLKLYLRASKEQSQI